MATRIHDDGSSTQRTARSVMLPAGRVVRGLSWLPRRPRRPPRPRVSPAVVEEEAATLLYGERTGAVNASPADPPLID